MFEYFLRLWKLTPIGEPIITQSSRLLPVLLADCSTAMLKVALTPEEQHSYILLNWWQGKGAVKVFAQHSNAILLEKAQDKQSLLTMAMNGQDDQATMISCHVIRQLHNQQNKPFPSNLTPLTHWFTALKNIAQQQHGIFKICLSIADNLLHNPQNTIALHGDIHHRNILDFGKRGWLAIDPKSLLGERGFEYANLLCNPDLVITHDPYRFIRQLNNIVRFSKVDYQRQLKWVAAYAGLSAAWFIEDKQIDKAKFAIGSAELALTLLNKVSKTHDSIRNT